jgi:hypothetical protein
MSSAKRTIDDAVCIEGKSTHWEHWHPAGPLRRSARTLDTLYENPAPPTMMHGYPKSRPSRRQRSREPCI